MNQKVKLIMGTGFAVALMGATPFGTLAKGTSADPDDYLASETNSIQELSETEAAFNSRDKARKEFYSSKKLKSLDKNAGNRLFKVEEGGFTYWTPVRPRATKSGVSNAEYTYENFYTAMLYDKSNSSDDSWLRHLWVADPSISRNFKSKKNIESQLLKKTTYESMKTVGKFVEKSHKLNDGGNFDDESGTWRFVGYAGDGSSSQDPLFPADYTFTGVKKTSWTEYAAVGNRLFNTTAYDRADHRDSKRELIKRLLDQQPDMKFKTVDQWMKILSLQSQPVPNPKTGKMDGSYGGASFLAYNSNGSHYKSFTLFGDSEDGSLNLNLSKLVITEAAKVNGEYPVVATISRKELESRDVVNKKISGKLVPGKAYRVVSTVHNASKLVSTKYNPTTTKVGYAVNYDGKVIEKDGVYDPQYDKKSANATTKGTIAKNGTVTTVYSFTMPSDLISGSNVRFGSMIGDQHRKAGDNLNGVDDDLMLVVPVSTGNIKAHSVTLVNENNKEVSSPVPGQKYKIRYTFKYSGTTQSTATKVTVNYQNTRKLPDGSQEAIIYAAGSKTSKDISTSKDIVLQNGKTFSVDSKSYQWYEIPYIHTKATVSANQAGLNTDSTDDKLEKTWNEKYDYDIQNLQVVSRTERVSHTTDQKQSFGVSFTVNNTMPKGAKEGNYAKDVNIRISLGGKTKVIKEHMVAGKNKNIVTEIELDEPIKASSDKTKNVVNAKVEVNYDKAAYETSNPGTTNNAATTKVDVKKLKINSKTGEVTNPTNTTTNTGAYVDNPLDPTAVTPVKKDSNKWVQNYEVSEWTAKEVKYTAMNNNKAYSFYQYTPKKTTTKKVEQNESYKISDVLFKSKITTENKWGAKKDGWVSLLTDSGHAQVKAGYGYELKMVVTYSTNAFSTQPAAKINKNGSGTSVRPQNVTPNISKDVYFKTSDGKILSATGINKTNQRLVPKVTTQTSGKVVIEYKLAQTLMMGIHSPGRIYIGEDTPNGLYKVQAWTPSINGIPTKNLTVSNNLTLFNASPLSDMVGTTVSNKGTALPSLGKDANGNLIVDTKSVPAMSILVVGSNKDDLASSVIQ